MGSILRDVENMKIFAAFNFWKTQNLFESRKLTSNS